MTDRTNIIARIFAETDQDRRCAMLPTTPDGLLDFIEDLPGAISDLETGRLAMRTINDLDRLIELYPDLPICDVKTATAEDCAHRFFELKLVSAMVLTPEYQEFYAWRTAYHALARTGQK